MEVLLNEIINETIMEVGRILLNMLREAKELAC
jgi:hypothetical protein